MRSSTVLMIALMGCSSTPARTTSDSGPDSPSDTGVADTGPKVETSGVLVIGTLASMDLGVAQMQHDQVAGGGQAQANAAGDIGHKAMLGTQLLGTKENEYLALDRWVEGSAIDAFYDNPQFVQAFSTIFASPPSRTVYTKRPTWAIYGTLESGNDADPHYWVIVRGTMIGSTDASSQTTHDMIVGGAKAQAMAAGDLAHIVYTGRDDAKQYLAVDIWKDTTNLMAFYSNPQLQQALASFISNPTIGVYHSTKWHQW